MSKFTLNGTSVDAKEFNFNTLVELDNYGVSMEDMTTKPLTFIRGYVAYCMGTSPEKAGQALNDHIVSGGDLNDIFEAMNAELEDSGFFRALQTEQTEVQAKNPKGQRKEK